MNAKIRILLLAVIATVWSSVTGLAQDRDPEKEERFRKFQEKRKRMRKGVRPDRRRPGESDANSLKVGELAPDFKLKSLDGKSQTQLKDFRGKKPVVLFFGSYT